MNDTKTGKPFASLWFGNFFEPAFNDKDYIISSMKDIEQMGFNAVMLDSKSWQDFWDRYEGKAASEYVAMQEFMIDRIKAEKSLSHWFLAIYLNGDNLYPNIRFSPPVIGEGVVDINGNPQRYYRYWADKAQESMIHHAKGLFSLYSDNHTEIEVDETVRLPICSMWDPIVALSFDEDGIDRYKSFLQKRYSDIEVLNCRYGTNLSCIAEICPADYVQDQPITYQDTINQTPAFWKRADNQLYKAYELEQFFMSMKKRFSQLDSRLYLMPNLSQWSIFLNIDTHNPYDLWDTANRGIDPFRVAKHLDNATFMTVPMLPDATPNPYVTEYQNSMIRGMNEGREFAVGFYLGRHMAFDIYREITPTEIIGSAVSSGASGYHAYGYCGLDDGGMMHKLGRLFKQSIADGNKWASRVIPQIKGSRKKQVAVLFPSQMAVTENYGVDGNAQRRLDSLGAFQAILDNGIMADVIHIDQIENGILSDYMSLVLIQNTCYAIDPSEKAEQKIREFVENGGVILHSINEPITKKIYSIGGVPHQHECIRFGEGYIPSGTSFVSYTDGEVIAYYEDSKLPAVVKNQYGNGLVYSFGYAIGEEYLAHKNHPVPTQYGNRVFYPINLTNDEPFSVLLRKHVEPIAPAERGISYAEFENGVVVVNHTSYPFDTSVIAGDKDFAHPTGDDKTLIGHSACWIKK